jgi:DNA-binding MarR family transcriptional regulator
MPQGESETVRPAALRKIALALEAELGRSVNTNQVKAIVMVHETPGIAQTEIMHELSLTPSGISVLVSLLSDGRKGEGRQAGWDVIEKRAPDWDHRAKPLYLTRRGRQIVKSVYLKVSSRNVPKAR